MQMEEEATKEASDGNIFAQFLFPLLVAVKGGPTQLPMFTLALRAVRWAELVLDR